MQIPLPDLDPRWISYHVHEDGHVYHHDEPSIETAQGILFLCPKCFVALGGRVGCHCVICWSRTRGTPETAEPGPGRWGMEGTSFSDLTLNGAEGSRSVLLIGGCAWHGFITNGIVTEV